MNSDCGSGVDSGDRAGPRNGLLGLEAIADEKCVRLFSSQFLNLLLVDGCSFICF